MLFTCLDSVHQRSKIFFIISISYLQVMVLRKRAKLSELSPDAGLSQKAGTEETCSRNLICFVERSEGASEVDAGETSTRRRPNACRNSEIPPSWPWKPCVSIAAGLLLAGLLALTQAWCVNSLHENLLWFSELTVRATRDWLPVRDRFFFLLKREITFFYILLCEEYFHVLNNVSGVKAQGIQIRILVFTFNMGDKQYVYSSNVGGLGLSCVAFT